jgi:hypothetical protein
VSTRNRLGVMDTSSGVASVGTASSMWSCCSNSRSTRMIGVRADWTKELVALSDGFRGSSESQADLLRD